MNRRYRITCRQFARTATLREVDSNSDEKLYGIPAKDWTPEQLQATAKLYGHRVEVIC